MPGYLGGIQSGTPSQESPPDILEAPHDGVKSGGLLRDSILGRVRGDTERSALPHHL